MKNQIFRIAIVFGILVVAGLAAYYYFYVATVSQYSINQGKLVQAKRAGDDTDALRAYESIIASSTSVEERGQAVLSIAGAKFNTTGDPSTWLTYTQDLKKVAVDGAVSDLTRGQAIALLATLYGRSGRDPKIFAEIYKDAPFNKYLVSNNPELSSINLAKWAYDLNGDFFSAIIIARLSSDHEDANQSATSTQYIDMAKDYLAKADAAVLKEPEENHAHTERYLSYRMFRAITVGNLAAEVGEPYSIGYKNEYEGFFKYADAEGSSLAKDLIRFARHRYAADLARDKDVKEEKVQLDLLAKDLSTLSDPNTSSFVWFLRNERTNRPNRVPWKDTLKMFVVSPDFKAAVAGLH